MKKDEESMFHSFRYEASYKDIQDQIHERMPIKREQKKRSILKPILIAAPVLASTVLVGVFVPLAFASSSSASKSAEGYDNFESFAGIDSASADSNLSSDGVVLCPKSLSVSYGSYHVLDDSKAIDLTKEKDQLLFALIHTSDKKEFEEEYAGLTYYINDGYQNPYDENSRLFFYSMKDVSDYSYLLCELGKNQTKIYQKNESEENL